MFRYATSRIRIDDEFDDMLKKLPHDSAMLLIMGIGFDRRMNIGLHHFINAGLVPDVWAIEHSKYEDEEQSQVDKAESNRDEFTTLCDCYDIKPDYSLIEMWNNDQAIPYLTAEINAAKYITERREQLCAYDYVFVDISALPRSVYFNFISSLNRLSLSNMCTFALVAENCTTDMEMRPIENDEKAHEVYGFTSSGSHQLNETVCVWLPVLGETEKETLQKEHEFIQGKYGSIGGVMPVLPFPSRVAKRADGLLKHYDQQLFSSWDVEKSSIIYVAEDKPFQIADRLESMVKRYCDVMKPFRDEDGASQYQCQFVFSVISSKLMRLGTLIAILRLRSENYKVSLVDVSCHGYKPANEHEEARLADPVPDRLFCVPLVPPYAEAPKPRVVGAGLFCVDIISYEYPDASGPEKVIQGGGSCGNVLSILRYHGWRAVAVLRESSDSLSQAAVDDIKSQGVEVKYAKRSGSLPRILVTLDNEKNPSHELTCPTCGKRVFTSKPLDEADLRTVDITFAKDDCYYHDRMTAGTRKLCSLAIDAGSLVFFEPNSARNKGLLEHALQCDIVKFSSAYVPDKVSNKLREKANTMGRIKLLVRTKGAEGLEFSYRQHDGKMSPWLVVPAVLDSGSSYADTSGVGDWLSAGIIDSLYKRDFIRSDLNESDIRMVFEDSSSWIREGASACGAQGALIGEAYFETRTIERIRYKTPYAGMLNEVAENRRCSTCLSLKDHSS